MDHAPNIEPLYVFAVFMLGSRDAAFAAVSDVLGECPGDPPAWLPALVARVVPMEKAARADRFAELNDLLRTDSTIPVDLSHPLVRGDARRLSTLLWELQRTCLITTLRGLAPARRAVFVLLHVLGLSVEDVARICDTTTSAIRVAEARGRRDLASYLGPRCEHMDPNNPCHCTARLGNALVGGLVGWPAHDDYGGTYFGPAVQRDVGQLYAKLPRVRLPIATG